jgi:hypothetical protein
MRSSRTLAFNECECLNPFHQTGWMLFSACSWAPTFQNVWGCSGLRYRLFRQTVSEDSDTAADKEFAPRAQATSGVTIVCSLASDLLLFRVLGQNNR